MSNLGSWAKLRTYFFLRSQFYLTFGDYLFSKDIYNATCYHDFNTRWLTTKTVHISSYFVTSGPLCPVVPLHDWTGSPGEDGLLVDPLLAWPGSPGEDGLLVDPILDWPGSPGENGLLVDPILDWPGCPGEDGLLVDPLLAWPCSPGEDGLLV